MPPNVMLVVFDAARRDALEPYGAAPGSTPTVAELARRGRAYEHAYATASWTLPSHASMFTGLLPRTLGLAQAPGGNPQGAKVTLERNSERLLAAVLRQSGYEAWGWSSNLWASAATGMDHGFNELRYVTSGREDRVNDLLDEGLRGQLAWAREGLLSRSDDGAAQAGEALRQSIEGWSGKPTFWFVNLGECHSPYLPPRPWNDFGPWGRVRAAFDSKRHMNFLSICLYAGGRHTIPTDASKRMRRLYHRSISYMDNWLAGVLAALERRGILDETVVIVTADHGENFGEDGLIAHGFSLNQQLIHVPLVIAGPGMPDDTGVISLAEIPRIVAQAAGLSDHPWRAREVPDGIAIAQYDPMATAAEPRIAEFATKFNIDEHGVERLTATLTCATDGHLKLITRDGIEIIFDLDVDPNELQPLDPSTVSDVRVAALREALDQSDHAGTAHIAAEPTSASPEASQEELAAIERQMKLLGYM